MSVNTKPFFPNDPADQHCLQACHQMAVATQVRRVLTLEQAEVDTGYAPGLLTWQFSMLLSLADRYNLHVVDFEDFDVHAFASDPEQSVRDQIADSAAAEEQISGSNLALEAERATLCVEHPRIAFRQGLPSLDDVANYCDSGATVIVLLNGAVLLGGDDYRPHFVIVRDVSDDRVIIDDPGPPAHPDWTIPKDAFLRAWHSPTPSVANLIAISRQRVPY